MVVMEKKGGAGIVILVIIIIFGLGIGSYFIFANKEGDESTSNIESESSNRISNSLETIMECRVGDGTIISTPFGMADGEITSVENHKLITGDEKSLCCRNVETQEGIKVKVCEEKNTNGDYTHRLAWKFDSLNNQYVKYSEYIPQLNAQCTNYFDESGEWSSRSCEEAISLENTSPPDDSSEPVVQESNEPSKIEDCEILETDHERTLCYRELAPILGDISICDLSSTSANAQICYSNVAKALKDPSICELITESILRNVKKNCLTNSQ